MSVTCAVACAATAEARPTRIQCVAFIVRNGPLSSGGPGDVRRVNLARSVYITLELSVRLSREHKTHSYSVRASITSSTDWEAFIMKANLLLLAGILASAVCAPIETLAEDGNAVHRMTPAAVQLPIEGELPSLGSATGWVNSPPLTATGLRGKVVLVEFWTYSCVNWLRTLPYVRAWSEKYKAQGLVVIGVHAPEFEFEKNVDNVRQAAKDMRVAYPIAIDSDHAIWRAFGNQYWPALYFVDAKGRIRHHHFGEGEYEKSEMIIQQLLTEAGNAGVGHELVPVDARGAELAADWANLRSPENYVGHERTENFASPGGAGLK